MQYGGNTLPVTSVKGGLLNADRNPLLKGREHIWITRTKSWSIETEARSVETQITRYGSHHDDKRSPTMLTKVLSWSSLHSAFQQQVKHKRRNPPVALIVKKVTFARENVLQKRLARRFHWPTGNRRETDGKPPETLGKRFFRFKATFPAAIPYHTGVSLFVIKRNLFCLP